MGRKKSDGPIVPEGRRKTPPTGRHGRGGKGTTASEEVEQLDLLCETADSPQGADGGAAVDQSTPAPRAVPKSQSTPGWRPPAMTMEEVANETNLRTAFKRVASNQGAPGPDHQSIEAVKEQLEELLPRLRDALLAEHYRPGQIRRVWIPKPGGGKRGLGIPNVIDRLVQQAVHQVLSATIEPRFHESSHGFRPGRSCHTAIAEAKEHLEEGFDWVVDIDLTQFFDRVHHERLLARLEKFGVTDRRVIRLIRRMLKAKVVLPSGVVVNTEEGTPQGGPLSPLLSNVVLDELDWELDRRGHRFVRYADDANIYVHSERAGLRVMTNLSDFIKRRLRLDVNQDKSAVARPEERHFLGFRLRRNPLDGQVEVLLSERSKQRLAHQVREHTPRGWGNSLNACIKKLNVFLVGWIGFFAICDGAESTFVDTDKHTRRRLRAIVLKHRRSKRNIARFLVQRRVKKSSAWNMVYSGNRSWWALSRAWAVHKGLNNFYFVERGLVSLEHKWRRLHPRVTAPRQQSLALGIAEGRKAGVGILAVGGDPTSRRAGCEAHKSGSVRAGRG